MSILTTAKEWYRCLIYPEYAETTWLRIKPHHERIALIVAGTIVTCLLIACFFVWAEFYHRVQVRRMYQEYYRTHPTEQIKIKGAHVI